MAESKHDGSGGGKAGEDEDHDWTLLSKASEHLGPRFDAIWRAFADENAEQFRGAKLGDEEHRLEWDELHRKYLEKVEAVLEGFIESEGGDVAGFLAECRSSLADEFCALFEEDVNKEFVERVLAILEYQYFHALIAKEAHERFGAGNVPKGK